MLRLRTMPSLRRDRIFVFDTETTGVDPAEDRVVELGAAYFEQGAFLSRRRNLVNPGRPIPPEASEVHGIHDRHVAEAPPFEAIATRFAMHLSGEAMDGQPPILLGYNAVEFDAPLLNAELDRSGHEARIDPTAVVDPILFVRWHLREMRHRKLGAVAERYGIPLPNAHSAAADSEATGRVALAMVEAGLLPDDVETALAQQAKLGPALEAEWAEFSYWVYRHRESGALHIGAGKHCGAPLDAVDPGYLRFILERSDDLTDATRAAFAERASA